MTHQQNPARRSTQGFTVVELLVVLTVMAVLASMAMPLARITVQREREQELKIALREIRAAIDAYQMVLAGSSSGVMEGVSVCPPSLTALTQLTADTRPGAGGQMIRFLRRVPRDPFADPKLSAEQTWGMRSYLSEANAPKAGADVYDVYSLSTQQALDGTWLKDW
ncbi:prepilin-type N-terminal cleavage/methylation domain-containing protein [Roseateles sp. P5_D6]